MTTKELKKYFKEHLVPSKYIRLAVITKTESVSTRHLMDGQFSSRITKSASEL